MPMQTSAGYSEGERKRDAYVLSASTPEQSDFDTAIEPNTTSRAITSQSTTLHPDQTRQLPRLVPTNDSTDRDATDSTGASPDSKNSRSRSPRKSALQYGYENFDFRDFTLARAYTFPPSLQRMRRDITDYSDSLAILPLHVRV